MATWNKSIVGWNLEGADWYIVPITENHFSLAGNHLPNLRMPLHLKATSFEEAKKEAEKILQDSLKELLYFVQ